MSIRKFNGPDGRTAWALTHIDAVKTDDGRTLRKVIDELSLGTSYDVSSLNNGAVFSSLSALLSDENIDTLIPASTRKGGMSIKFIQGTEGSSDNKYVQYQLIKDTWSTDPDDWTTGGGGNYPPEGGVPKSDLSEEVQTSLDKADNSVSTPEGAGQPGQVLQLDSESVPAWVTPSAGTTPDSTMSESSTNAVQNKVITKEILLGTVYDVSAHNDNATFASLSALLNAANIDTLIPTSVRKGEISVKFVQSSDNKYVQYRLMKNAWTTDTDTWSFCGDDTLVENPEYIEVKTDSEYKIIEGINADGIKVINIPTIFNDDVTIEGNIINAELTNTLNSKVDKVEGKSLIDEDVSDILSDIDNPEYIEVVKDAEEKLISYRRKDGALHEDAGIVTSSIKADMIDSTPAGYENFMKGVRDTGFTYGIIDWSDSKSLHIPEPNCAVINFTNITAMPTTKTDNFNAYMQFWDMQGNYFKKEVIMNAQGRSSMGFPKKNISIDICNNNGWDDDDTFSLQIGDWVPQDGFHIKAFYTDALRCMCPVTYKWYDEISRTRGEFDDYVWKRALLDLSTITATSNGTDNVDDTMAQFNTGAKCFPSGFPCIVLLNGEFYGIFSFQTKKHRDVYHMKKSSPNQIHLDGIISNRTVFNGDPAQIWPTEGESFEVRNPKNLVYASAHNGSYKYDADVAEAEIAGNNDGTDNYDTWVAGSYAAGKIVEHNGHKFLNTIAGNTAEPIYHVKNNSDDSPDFKNKTGCGWLNCTNTVIVKNSIIALSKYYDELNTYAAAYFNILVNEGWTYVQVGRQYAVGDFDPNHTYNTNDKVFYKGATFSSTIDHNKTAPCADNAEGSDAAFATFREEFEIRFDPKNLIDYEIEIDVLNDYDSIGQNTQWITYNGIKWFLMLYDVDCVMGAYWQAQNTIQAPKTGKDNRYPLAYIQAFYNEELNTRYAELRDIKLIDAKHIAAMVSEWMSRLGGKNAYDKEWAKWTEFIKKDSLLRVYKWLQVSISNMDVAYSYNQN